MSTYDAIFENLVFYFVFEILNQLGSILFQLIIFWKTNQLERQNLKSSQIKKSIVITRAAKIIEILKQIKIVAYITSELVKSYFLLIDALGQLKALCLLFYEPQPFLQRSPHMATN